MMFAIIFIISLNILIFVHELGHFLVAKKNGLRVEEFGLGIPPRIFGIKKGETVYSINALPIGGFVKIYGEDGLYADKKESFASRSAGTRIKILAAGVFMNLIFGIILFIAGFNIGIPAVAENQNLPFIKDLRTSILEVQKNSPAEAAGLKMGDRILLVQKEEEIIENPTVEELQQFTKKYGGQKIILNIERGKDKIMVEVIPREKISENEGPLGVVIGETGFLKYPFWRSLWEGVKAGISLFINVFVMIFIFLKSLIFQGKMIGEVAGPVGITILGTHVLKLGLAYFIQFLATLSIYLAAINLVPFPALDGSRIFFILLEKIRGKAVATKTENLIHTIGFALLLLIFFVITYRDIIKLF